MKPSSKIQAKDGSKTPSNVDHLKIRQNDNSDNKSHLSKYSAVVFTVEKSPSKAKELDNNDEDEESDNYDEDFEDDFEPYETSNEDEKDKTEKDSSKKPTSSD